MSNSFFDHPMDKVILLLDKITGEEAGRILAYYSRNPSGAVCHARVILYPHGEKILGRPESTDDNIEGRAGGYGYDKYSAAVSDCIHKMGLGCTHDQMDAFTFKMKITKKDDEQKKWVLENKRIPVYGGTDERNVKEAFELYFRVIEVL